MNSLNPFFKTIVFSILILLLFIVADLQLTRGYFLNHFTALPKMGETVNDFEGKFDYKIHKKEDGNFSFAIQNHSILPANMIVYRNDAFFYDIEDSLFFVYGNASRPRLKLPHGIVEDGVGFDCGTGIGMATFNPFEKLEGELNRSELIDNYFLLSSLTEPIAERDSFIAPPPLFFDTLKSNFVFTGRNSRDINFKDSIEVQFYLPIYSLFTGKQYNVYSNPFKIAYLEAVNKIFQRDCESFRTVYE